MLLIQSILNIKIYQHTHTHTHIYIYICRGTQKFLEFLKNLLQVFVQVWNFSPLRSTPPCDWMQQWQHRSQSWKHCLKSSTEILLRVTIDSRWTSAMSAKCLPFKSCFIHGNQTSRKEHGQAQGGTQPLFCFWPKWRCFAEVAEVNGNRWWPSTAFLLKRLDSVSSNWRGTQIAASSHRGSASKGTKVLNLYKYFK